MSSVHNGQKIRILILYEILKSETDENHKLTTNELLEKLKSHGLLCDRKTLYDDIDILNEYGFEVLTDKSKSNSYYVVSRDFEIPELRILIDAVQAAGFVTPKKSEELVDKIDIMPKDIRWHMIGHLQRNKVKYIVGKVAMIHSVDSLRLAEEISKESVKKNVVSEILIEVNVGMEESKFGITTDNALDMVIAISQLPNIVIRGFMTSAPFVDNAEDNRKIFKCLHNIIVDIRDKNIDNTTMDVLSMGMTNDYIVAVEEGASMVRVGTAIFGARNYNI